MANKVLRRLLPALTLLCTGSVFAQTSSTFTPATSGSTGTTLPAGVPLRIQLDHGYPLKPGTQLEGHLIAPVYRVDHEVLPANTKVTGSITGKHSVSKGQRADALLNGDFTPLAVPEVSFDHLVLPDGQSLGITTSVTERTATIIHMGGPNKRPSLVGQAKAQVKQMKQDARDTLNTVKGPGKGDRLRRYLYGQLPYHPQRIWTGTQYDADLTQPLTIPERPRQPLPVAILNGKTPTGHIEARLTQDLSSETAKQGTAVEAVLSKPLFDPTNQQVLLPEGTRLSGSVQQAQPAKWFSRNGKLRFTFRKVDLPEGTEPVAVHGQMTSAEGGQGQNLSIDQEGGAKAQPDKNKVLAPLVLGLLASNATDRDAGTLHTGVVSNGFGIVIRVVTMATTNRNLAAGFAYFAVSKSVYRRWIAKGHEVDFPKDTRLEIDLAER
jgi:hypothetical protein